MTTFTVSEKDKARVVAIVAQAQSRVELSVFFGHLEDASEEIHADRRTLKLAEDLKAANKAVKDSAKRIAELEKKLAATVPVVAKTPAKPAAKVPAKVAAKVAPKAPAKVVAKPAAKVPAKPVKKAAKK